MSEIKCPHCGQMFTVDESEYNQILTQVRGAEFEKEVSERLHMMQEAENSKIEVKVLEAEKKATEKATKEAKTEIEKSEKALKEANEKSAKLESEIANLKAELKVATSTKDTELELQKTKLEASHKDELEEVTRKHENDMRTIQEELERYKDFKARSSTKMIGESLEQHCMDEFDKYRATAFRGDYFEKDNEVSKTSGSKGDFIYRAYDDEGNELVSIMFEMKNEAETTQDNQRHKNADFFKELDKDRKEKNCDYAILCSLLEADSELYNQGIVDVSHRYEKMYVIRPQFLIPIISLIKNSALQQLSLKKQLVSIQRENVDIVNFENQLEEFKKGFGRNCELTSRKFQETLNEIDKAIDHLVKTKEALTSCDKNLALADKKLEDLKVTKLIKNSPSLKEEYNKSKAE